MRLELEELESRCAPTGLLLSGSIAQQATQVQQFVQQELSFINANAPAIVKLAELRIAFQAIEPVILAFAANGINAMGSDPNALAGFAASLDQVSAALSLPWH